MCVCVAQTGMSASHLAHLKAAADLVTPQAAVRAGFVALALERNRRASPHMEQARALKAAASLAKTPRELLHEAGIQAALLTAAGISDKASKHLSAADHQAAIIGLIEQFLEPAGTHFVEELVYRFLLTRGDTLGDSMRNVGGALAQRKFSRSLIAYLGLSRTPCHWLHATSGQWLPLPEDNADLENELRGLSWRVAGQPRTLVYNLTVPAVKNNIDLCLFAAPHEAMGKALYADQGSYLALGELKGGIDPAGADEHWKTARTALHRIHSAYAKLPKPPALFFVGAAIEQKMAGEIWAMLESNELAHAANLGIEAQTAALSNWICTL